MADQLLPDIILVICIL